MDKPKELYPQLANIKARREHELKRKQDELIDLAYTIYHKSEAGLRYMQLMCEVYLLDSAVANPEHPENFAWFREGQNSIIRQMRDADKRYEDKEALRPKTGGE